MPNLLSRLLHADRINENANVFDFELDVEEMISLSSLPHQVGVLCRRGFKWCGGGGSGGKEPQSI